MVFQAVITFPDEFRYASGVWYIDDIASLMALIKGRSDNLDLDHLAQMIHLLLYHLHCSIWFEWIQSKSNWSDGISRDGFKDRFVQNYAFQCHTSSVPSSLWQLPIFLLSLVFSFLWIMLWDRNTLGARKRRFAPPEATPANQASLNRSYQSYMAKMPWPCHAKKKEAAECVCCRMITIQNDSLALNIHWRVVVSGTRYINFDI